MEFAIISPTAGLERYATLSKTHLVLSHIYRKDPVYSMFYCARKAAGDFIILDNGAYEGFPNIDFAVIGELEPDVVVLPDFLLQPWKKTWHAAIAWLDTNYDNVSQFECLYIPQAEKGDLLGFIQSYQEVASDPRISWLGIPRALPLSITDNPLARVEFARLVRAQHPNLKLHAFGMVAGDVHELPYLRWAGVNSVDSSAPVWRGWNGWKIQDDSWNGLPVDFSAPWPPNVELSKHPSHLSRHEIILDNLEACGVSTQP